MLNLRRRNTRTIERIVTIVVWVCLDYGHKSRTRGDSLAHGRKKGLGCSPYAGSIAPTCDEQPRDGRGWLGTVTKWTRQEDARHTHAFVLRRPNNAGLQSRW